MQYLLVLSAQDRYFLLMSEGNGDPTELALSVFPTRDDVFKSFRLYIEAFASGDPTRYSGAMLGISQMMPTAIAAPENPHDILAYLPEEANIVQVSGGAIGSGYKGIEVKEEILKLKQFELWKEILIQAGLSQGHAN